MDSFEEGKVASTSTPPYIVPEKQTLRVKSGQVGEEFEIHVYLPISLRLDQERFPVLYAMD